MGQILVSGHIKFQTPGFKKKKRKKREKVKKTLEGLTELDHHCL